ncbi:MAG: aminotransferase class I/II-fold pyridoxal phosphate-dependent enzyme [bacterium]|nr:aminotransferase class I/II-fold pyridoxal phosphate-dependent enzyme [bacterium]
MDKKKGISTQSVHLGCRFDPATGSIVTPLFQNAAFAYNDLDEWRAVSLNKAVGYIYSRNTNPTTNHFEKRMAALEGAESATSFATGMAAINTTLFALLESGKRAVTVRDAYGATYLHFTQILPRFNIDCQVCETGDTEAIEAAMAAGCDLLYLETPTNPTLKVLDLEYLTKLAHKKGALVVVDNTFATPINQSPLELGADVVIHSATKFLCGHGDALGGIACGGAEIIDRIFRYRELTGPSMDPHCAFLMLRSLKTLGLRVQRQNENALAVARFLETQPQVAGVFYPGLESHPGHEIARKQMTGFGGVLSFELQGGFEAVKEFLPRLEYAYMAANLGQVETVVGPPSTTSHVELTAEERKEAGVPEGLIRYSVGIEDIDDLKADIENALKFYLKKSK